MFYAEYHLDGEKHAEIYYSNAKFISDTFSPLCKDVKIIAFATHGRTFAERRESVRNVAMKWSDVDVWPLSWMELQIISDWFYTNGKRYGLLKEFRENGLA